MFYIYYNIKCIILAIDNTGKLASYVYSSILKSYSIQFLEKLNQEVVEDILFTGMVSVNHKTQPFAGINSIVEFPVSSKSIVCHATSKLVCRVKE